MLFVDSLKSYVNIIFVCRAAPIYVLGACAQYRHVPQLDRYWPADPCRKSELRKSITKHAPVPVDTEILIIWVAVRRIRGCSVTAT
jgi:hypothetical protein